MEVICLSGYARAGKDEAAAVLVQEYGFIQVAFADKLREVLYALNPLIAVERGEVHSAVRTDGTLGPYRNLPVSMNLRVQDIIDKYGWDGYKETKYKDEIRYLLQRLGTEAGRETLWDSIWIDAALTGLPEVSKVVVSDGRFFNEFNAVRERGGSVWRIEREGIGPVTDHRSETEAPKYPWFDQTINNDGTLEEYRQKVRDAYEMGLQI